MNEHFWDFNNIALISNYVTEPIEKIDIFIFDSSLNEA